MTELNQYAVWNPSFGGTDKSKIQISYNGCSWFNTPEGNVQEQCQQIKGYFSEVFTDSSPKILLISTYAVGTDVLIAILDQFRDSDIEIGAIQVTP